MDIVELRPEAQVTVVIPDGATISIPQNESPIFVLDNRTGPKGPQGPEGGLYKSYAFISGAYVENALIYRVKIGYDVVIPETINNLSKAIARLPSQTVSVFVLMKDDVPFGTVTFDPGQFTGVYSVPVATLFDEESILSIVAPTNSDPTLSDVGLTLVGTRV